MVSLDGLIYVIGGLTVSGQTSQVLVYNPETDSWSGAAPMQKSRDRFSAVAAGGLIYAINGNSDYDTTVEAYNPHNNTWWSVADTPLPHLLGAAAEANGIIYAIGGWNSISYVHAYNPGNNTWWEVASLNTARQNLAAAEVNGTIYAFGGVGFGTLSSLEAYDPATNSWSVRASMSITRNMPAAVSVGNRYLVAIGGEISEGGPDVTDTINKTEVYDTFDNTWSTLSNMPTGRYDLGAARSGAFLYAIGGGTIFGGDTILNQNEALDISDLEDTSPPEISITSPSSPAYLSTDEVKISGTSSDNWGIKKVEANIDGANWTMCNGTTSWNIDLDPNSGINNISIKATDIAGNINTTTTQVIKDTTSPTLTIATPTNGTFVSNATVFVSGNVTDDYGIGKVEISRDHVSWTLCNGTGSWTGALVLVKGSNMIYARVTDKAQNTNQSTIHIFLDDELPVIAMTVPSPGAHISKSSLNVSGSATDNVQLLKVEISSDGANWTPASGNSTWSSPVKLKEGRNTIYVRATDEAGNVATFSADVTYKSAKSSPGFDLGIGLMALLLGGLTSAGIKRTGKPHR